MALSNTGIGKHGRSAHLALALLCLLAAACGDDGGGGATPFVATFEPATCEIPLPEGQDPGNVACGWLTVPENRRHPERRTIKLAVVTLAATGTDPEPDPLLILSGGPGQWAIDSVLPRFTAEFAAPIQSKRDIVVFDQRGSGRSQPALNCPEVMRYRDALAILTTTEEDAEIDTEIFVASLRSIGAGGQRSERLLQRRDGGGHRGLDDGARVRPVQPVRPLVRHPLALTALRDQRGARIRSAVLDSVVPLQADGVRTGSAVERSFDLLLADCAADPACDRAYPNLRQTAFDLIDQFNREILVRLPRP